LCKPFLLRYSTKAKVTTIYYSPDEILTADTERADRDDYLKPILDTLQFFDNLPFDDKMVDTTDALRYPLNIGSELTKSCYKILNEVVGVYDDFGKLTYYLI